ncbi:MAG: TIGR03564 family F420-dependent LLM class oxidoreductase [Chloroflexi bacterium]|nr:TIGR03564 family F420-dependent LLM class oxidoreductase [Chloroflexota bacterium]
MRIGLMLGARRQGYSLDVFVKEVANAEEDGIQGIWLPHIMSSGYDAITALAIAGRETSRIELATAVVPIFSRHPLAMAQHALTAQSAMGGRFTLGIGLSHQPSIEDVMGLSYQRPAKHMQEYFSVLSSLVTTGKADFSGEFYNVRAEIGVPDASPCPIVIAALAPRMLRIAGEATDGTITWMAGIRTIEGHIVPKITTAASEAGRPDPRVCVALPFAVHDDESEARDKIARTFGRYGEITNYRRVLDIEGVEGPSEVAVVGNEAQVERQIRAFADAGATEFIASVVPVGDDSRASLRRSRDLLKGLVGKV